MDKYQLIKGDQVETFSNLDEVLSRVQVLKTLYCASYDDCISVCTCPFDCFSKKYISMKVEMRDGTYDYVDVCDFLCSNIALQKAYKYKKGSLIEHIKYVLSVIDPETILVTV